MNSDPTPADQFIAHLVTVICFTVVAVATCFNLLLLLFAAGVVEEWLGSTIDSWNHGLALALAMGIQTGFFGLLYAPACFLTRRSSLDQKKLAVIFLAAAYVAVLLTGNVVLIGNHPLP